AEELVKKLTFAWSRGAIGYTWYCLRNTETGDEWEDNLGLVTREYQPKVVFCAYNNLTATLRDLQPLRQLELGSGHWGFVFGDPTGVTHRQVVVLWRSEQDTADADFVLRVGQQATVTEIDFMGNRRRLPVTEGSVVLSPRVRPVYLEITNGNALASPPETLFAPTSSLYVETGKSIRVLVDCHNPRTTSVRMNLQAMLPHATQVYGPFTVDLAAGASRRVEAVLPNTATTRFKDGENATIRYTVAGTPLAGQLQIPLCNAIMIPAGAMSTREADILLDSPSSVTNMFSADPANLDKRWKGPQDLSARAWLGCTDNALTMCVDVTDDTFVQNEQQPETIWKGDSVQFAVQLPGQSAYWEFGFAHMADGRDVVQLFETGNNTIQGAARAVRLHTTPLQNGLRYEIEIPYTAIGLSDHILESGVRACLQVNDNDTGVREGWIALTPGIGTDRGSDKFALLRFSPTEK
ncbi:MAG TPA: sugar-binding protein, partial [Armatimonadota bacterium]|nr:sugar-binding protein [Armatimonadota bacterium]